MSKFSKTGFESGASDGPFITKVGGAYLQPFGITPNDMLMRHRSALNGVDLNDPTPAMKGGNYFQGGALQWFNSDYNAKVVEPKRGFKNEFCNMTASLDGIFTEDWSYEGTTIAAGNVWECKIPRFPSNPTDAMERVLQVQAQMDCADCELAVIAELARSDFVWRIAIVRRHEGTVKAVREAVDVFWDHMKNNTDYPPITNKEANQMIGSNHFDPIDLRDGPTEEFSAEARQLLIDSSETYIAAKSTKNAAAAMMDAEALNIKNVMGGVETVLIPGGKISFSTVNYDAKPEKVTPAKEAYSTRRLTIKEDAA
mgnify:CR=1 FL=1|tara:strand:+ start:2274 stop:3209 length:936 start_codon:yes stop_codon:yes gene_type:complete